LAFKDGTPCSVRSEEFIIIFTVNLTLFHRLIARQRLLVFAPKVCGLLPFMHSAFPFGSPDGAEKQDELISLMRSIFHAGCDHSTSNELKISSFL
jgi:hypothetical protein